jgi:succinylarginine dihydrolase
MAHELNFDGLVGPFHHYAGFSFGNVASAEHHGQVASPRQAALQGLAKMRLLHDLGVPQAVMPPHLRPDLSLARRMGWDGDDLTVLADLAREAPLLLAACYAPSSMWTANAATVSPSADSLDGLVHVTPANLQNKIHRSIEPAQTSRILRAILRGPRFVHHEPLPATAALGDEGAANHTRFAPRHGARGVQLFVHGESAANPWSPRPKLFPARQTFEACLGLQRLHRLPPAQVVHAQQNPAVIDQGVFHNDVISVGHLGVFLCHETAFRDGDKVLAELGEKYAAITGDELRVVLIRSDDVPVPAAVSSYLFNSQLVTDREGRLTLVAPRECEENERVRACLDRLVGDGAIGAIRFVELRQSMHGGGGPACLRLRVVLSDDELAAIAPGVRFSDDLEAALRTWIERHYRDRMAPADLADPALLGETREALDALTRILGLGALYDFQR